MPSSPDPLDLQCAVTLAETLSFTDTANRLHMTQPGVTARINRVEKNLGYKLFERRKGMVKAITPEGFIFVEEAKLVLEQLNRLVLRAEAAHRAVSETLSISRSHHTDLQLLSIVVAAQAIEGSHISIEAPCNSDEEAIDALLTGKADVALVSWPINENQIAALHLVHDPLVAVLPENHMLRDRTEIHVVDLRNEQIIGSKYQFPATLKEALLTKCKSLGFIPGWLCITASPAESVHLVDTGVRAGITIVTKQYAKELALTKATCVPIADAELAFEYGAAYRQSDHRPVLNAFLQYLVEKCRPMPSRKRKPARATPSLTRRATG
ncbi:DNA-binding transcriptional LysR family regulator [Silvibacterium bohemicum]|uniref:DNA-binding transcriptional LysR family regulator n=1 Tax=Silvibacterium bohemicum TaxID=1577686 RepID=A0A841K1R0_9BACT|nr:LysR family transcriptional regulator [Silvibacterium bohemicum]MBB6147340.1 DNA-binding transcriptional LysR family regulator [Silvibacterium bohemicum]